MFRIQFIAALFCTAVLFTLGSATEAQAGKCGAHRQVPCKIWQRIPSCDQGLFEDFGRNRCMKAGVDCGRLNQRACKVWERVPSCNTGLVEVLGKGFCADPRRAGIDCGNTNQRPCTVLERIPSCNSGLVEDFAKNTCVAGPHWQQHVIASAKLAEIGHVIAAQLGFATQIARDPAVRGALQSKDTTALARSIRDPQDYDIQLPGGALIRTLSVGASVGGKFIIGGEGGFGATHDLRRNAKLPAYAYATANWELGLGFGANAGIDVGFWVCQANKIGGDSWGVKFSVQDIVKLGMVAKGLTEFKKAVSPGFDIGVGLWFGYDNTFQGFTLTPSVGGGLDTGGYVKATTAVQNDPAVTCEGRPLAKAAKPGDLAPVTNLFSE